MKPRKPYELRSALGRKGFELVENDHTWCYLVVGGRRVGIRTKIDHHRREYDDIRLGWMAKELRLRLRELDQLVECPLSGPDYVRLLSERGHLG